MSNWQDFAPGTAGHEGEPASLGASQEAQPEERTRLLRLIDFFADYDAQRNPPVCDISKYDLYVVRDTDLPEVPGVTLSPSADAWLTVDFLDYPSRPDVPRRLVSLLGEAETITPHVRPTAQATHDDAELDESPRATDLELIEAAEEWIASVWEPFATQWVQVTAVKTLHRDLFQQRELLTTDRESVELVWGFGRLRWLHDGERIDHPLICIPVEVEQDEATQRVRVCPTGSPEVESRYLAGLSLADRPGFMSIRQAMDEDGADLWDPQVLRNVLRPLIRAIDHDGMLVERTRSPEDAAIADSSWVLYMRRKLPDYQGFLDRMRMLYRDDSVAVPETLRAVVSDTPSALAGQAATSQDGNYDLEPLLLPLPTNEEQQRILSQAQRSTGVTVQGPPGTGKSHTIANIISHYVAYGKRVLVVAEKEQALRTLTDKIPSGIKDLAVSILGADAESRRELESAIGQIQAKVTAIDKVFVDDQIRQLTFNLDTINRAIAVTTDALLATRETEVERLPGVWDAGEEPTRAEAAKWIAARESDLNYIDDVLTPTTPVPLTGGELANFVTLIREIGIQRADSCTRELPDLAAIPPAGELQVQFERLAELRASADALSQVVHNRDLAINQGRERLETLAAKCRAGMEWMNKSADSWIHQVRTQADDPSLAADWRSFGQQLYQDREAVLQLRRVVTAHDILIPDMIEPAFLEALRNARDRLIQSGKLGMFASQAKRAMQECGIDGRKPSTTEDIDLCLQAAELMSLRRRMCTRWQNQIDRVGSVKLDDSAPEDTLGTHLRDLQKVLIWPETWQQLRADLWAAGIVSPDAADAGTLEFLAVACTEAVNLISLRDLSESVKKLYSWLQERARSTLDSSPLWTLFADALSREDATRWHSLRDELEELHEIAPAARHMHELRRRLSDCAPIWTARIIANSEAAGDAIELSAAWQWRQLDSWVREGLAGKTPAELQSRLEELAAERRRTIADLVSERAWRRLADNLGDRQRQALNSYVRAVTRYGKTGGKFAQRWLAEIRTALDESKSAVPAWIMPTSRALTSFRPETHPPFDVLVVDEASQIGMAAVPLLALAEKTIVVGDDKQTSPQHVGLNRQQVFNLLDEHVAMVPKYRTLFDPDNSLYDIAFQKFPDVVMLTEHFRCLPQIISFSNTHAYGNKIVPLRDKPPRPKWAALGVVKVLDGYRSGWINEPEADAVVELVAELCFNSDYDSMDMGIISLLGSTQSKLIADKLYDRLGPEVIRQRRIRSGEPANFQGDERDVIIISTVVAVDPAIPLGKISAMTDNAAMRRINVAASRARQQMWIVHSVDPDRFSSGDLRGTLIRHCRDAGVGTEPERDLLDACESQFERDVLQRIVARGYRRVWVQYSVGRYRIDIVVEGPDNRLAVECDGDRWHGPDVWHKDRARQQVLERAGWTFERIRGSAFYRDPDAALLPLWERLKELSIPTGDWWSDVAPKPTLREVIGLGLTPDLMSAGEQPSAATEPFSGQELRAAESPLKAAVDAQPAKENASTIQRVIPLVPYEIWPSRRLGTPDAAHQTEITDGLLDIVTAEGPMYAHRAFRIYVQAAGGFRVGREVRRILDAALRRCLNAGLIEQLNEKFLEQDEQTVYATGSPSVLLREIGPRQLHEVPRSEVASLIKSLGLTGAPHDSIKRTVLDAYGLVRLTARTSVYLDECLAYNLTEVTTRAQHSN